jgi:hypothetical protein
MTKVDERFRSEGAAALARMVLEAWPHERLNGFVDGFHLEWTRLYCARADAWFHGNLIEAFGKVIAVKYQNNATVFLPAMSTPTPN